MKTLTQFTAATALGAAALLLTSTATLRAQDRPSPEEMRQRMMDQMKERFEVTDDAAWKLISDRIDKVMEARRATAGMGGGPGFGGRPGGPGGPGGQGGQGGGQGGPGGRPQGDRPANDNGGNDQARAARGPGGPGGPGGGQGGPGGFGRPADPETEALQKAITANASPDEVKGLLAKLREARKDKEAKLEAAQEELRKVLSVRQEALAVAMGLLK
jgi:hypothetical protein